MQAEKQPVTLRSFNHQETLKMFLLSDKLWLILSATFDCFCYSLYYFNNANRFSDG